MPYRPPALTLHRGLATWGERLVPLADFRRAPAEAGLRLSPEERAAAVARLAGAARGRHAGRRSVSPHRRLRRRLQQPLRARGPVRGRCPARHRGGLLPGRPGRLRAATRRRSGRSWSRRCARDPGQLRGVAGRRPRGLQLRLHRSAGQPLRRALVRLYGAELLARLQGLDGPPAAPPPRAGRRARASSSSTARRGGSTSSCSVPRRRSPSWKPFSISRAATERSAPIPGSPGTGASPPAATPST